MKQFKFKEEDKDKIKAAVASLEQATAGELVLYFARKSDNYPGAGWKFAGIIGGSTAFIIGLLSYLWMLPGWFTPLVISILILSLMVVAYFLAVFVLIQIAAITPAIAAIVIPLTPGKCGTGTIGSVINCLTINSEETHYLIWAMSYLFGLFIGVWAIKGFYDCVNQPQQNSIFPALQRTLVAGGLFALPMVIEASVVSMTGGNVNELETSGWSGTTSGGGLDAMVGALMMDGFVPMKYALLFFARSAGVLFIVIGIFRLMKTSQDGVRGPGGIGTIFTFLMGGALLSMDQMLSAAANTMFGTDVVKTKATLKFNAGLKPKEEQHVLVVISSVLSFVMIIGLISFVRGIFIVRQVAEGNQQASLMAGLTHILGGAIAINLGPFLNAVQQTFGLAPIGVNFG